MLSKNRARLHKQALNFSADPRNSADFGLPKGGQSDLCNEKQLQQNQQQQLHATETKRIHIGLKALF